MGSKSFIGGLALGAGAVYLLDPDRGKLRRERLREALEALAEEGTHRYGSRLNDIEGLGGATLVGSSPGGARGMALKLAGAALALYALTRGGRGGSLLKTAATGMLLRGIGKGNVRIPGMSGRDRRRADRGAG
jgi:hypothetical protein